MSNVHIELGTPYPRGRDTKIVIDGHDVGPAMTGFALRHEVGHLPRLELELRAHDVTSFTAPHVQVLIDGAATEYLERAGWTPPPGVPSVLPRDADGCPCERVEVDAGTTDPDEPEYILGLTVPTCPVHGVNARKAGTDG